MCSVVILHYCAHTKPTGTSPGMDLMRACSYLLPVIQTYRFRVHHHVINMSFCSIGLGNSKEQHQLCTFGITMCAGVVWLIMTHLCRGCDENGKYLPRAGIKSTSMAFWASVLPLHHIGCWCHHYTHGYQSMQFLASEVSADYYTHPLEL